MHATQTQHVVKKTSKNNRCQLTLNQRVAGSSPAAPTKFPFVFSCSSVAKARWDGLLPGDDGPINPRRANTPQGDTARKVRVATPHIVRKK